MILPGTSYRARLTVRKTTGHGISYQLNDKQTDVLLGIFLRQIWN